VAKVPSDWEFVLCLPNLHVPLDRYLPEYPDGYDLESGVVAIRGGEDPLVSEIRIDNPAVEQILGSFRNEYGESFTPAVLMIRKDAPQAVKINSAAFNDFRNALAIASILPGRAATALGGGSTRPNWADTFDFHPAQLSVSGTPVLQSPAITNAVGNEALHLSGSPSVSPFSFGLHPDRYLYRCLGRQWRKAHLTRAGKNRFARSLFRSLEVAYHALSVGVKSFGSETEYGLQVAMWISAIEILAWPAQGRANLVTVFDLLKLHEVRLPPSLRSRRLRHRRFRAKWDKKVIRINAIQRGYAMLYRARNEFLHGEPVSFANLFAKHRQTRVSLPRLAPLLYRYALAGYLTQAYPPGDSMRTIVRDVLEMVDESTYEDATLRVLGIQE
jgi:hypothetical protein